MKLIIQIPCLNEENTIESVIKDLPQKLSLVDEIEYLIIDDGSTDKTADVAKRLGVQHIISLNRNMGLAHAFQTGINYCKKINADIVVNTDGDNQYQGKYIENLVAKLLESNSDIVIGCRDFNNSKYFSFFKKQLQKIGSFVVRLIAGQNIDDASSGFRAYSKKSINNIFITSNFSYTIDSLIQAYDKNLKISQIPIETNKPTRPSRLSKSSLNFILKQFPIIFICFAFYRPLMFFSLLAIPPAFMGFFLIIRFLFHYFYDPGSGLIQSLIIGSLGVIIGLVFFMLGIIGSLIRYNRKLIEKFMNNE